MRSFTNLNTLEAFLEVNFEVFTVSKLFSWQQRGPLVSGPCFDDDKCKISIGFEAICSYYFLLQWVRLCNFVHFEYIKKISMEKDICIGRKEIRSCRNK